MKVLTFNAEGVVVPHALAEIAETLKAMGHEVLVFDLIAAKKRGTVVKDVLLRIEDFRPELIVTVDLVGLGLPYFLIDPAVKIASLFFDNPSTYFSGKESFLDFEHYHLFSIEKSFVEKGRNRYYIPWCFDPKVFFDQQRERIYDVSFVGRLDEGRRDFFLTLAETVKIDVWGDEVWREIAHPNIVFHGAADPRRETPQIYNQSKIVICPNASQFENGLSERLYNVMACGACAAIDDTPVLTEHFRPGKDLIAYSNVRDLQCRLQALLDDRERLRAMAISGREKVEANHTYEMILKCVLDQLAQSPLSIDAIESSLQQFDQSHPGEYDQMLFYFVRLHYNARQFGAALRYLSRLLAAEESNANLYLLTMSCLVQLGQQAQAESFFQLFCQGFPDLREQAEQFMRPDFVTTVE